MTMRVTMIDTRMGESGSLLVAGSTYTVSDAFGAYLVGAKRATDTDGALTPGNSEPARYRSDPLTGMATGLTGPNGSAFFGPVTSAVWMKVPSLFRFRLTGTGTAVMDARDSLGNITSALYSYTLTAATDQIEFPYAGDDAVNIRVTLTGTVTCEVI